MSHYFTFTARHYSRNISENIAAALHGYDRPVHRTSGKVRAWTRWGARRYIRKLFGSQLIEIVEVVR